MIDQYFEANNRKLEKLFVDDTPMRVIIEKESSKGSGR